MTMLARFIPGVTVTAADFNGNSWDGTPFDPSPAPEWFMGAIHDGRITLIKSDRDYALWNVKTAYREIVVEPGDKIIQNSDGTLAVLIGAKP